MHLRKVAWPVETLYMLVYYYLYNVRGLSIDMSWYWKLHVGPARSLIRNATRPARFNRLLPGTCYGELRK